MRHIGVLFTAGVLLSGCANLNSIYRTPQLHRGQSLVLDASEHVVVNGGQARTDRDGNGVYESLGPIVCAQPYPDAITASSAGGGLNALLGSDSNAQAAFALGSASASIGLRTQSIQLLRDQGYRLCESYMNGSIDAFNYRILQRRHQSLMTAILAIEQLTGAVVAGQAGVGATSSASPADAINALVQRRGELAVEVEALNVRRRAATAMIGRAEDEDNKPSEAELAAARAEVIQVDAALPGPTAGIAAIDRILDGGDAGEAQTEALIRLSDSQHSTTIDDQTVAAIATTVERITLDLLNQDYTGQMCFDYARERPVRGREAHLLDRFCQSYFEQYNRGSAQRTAILEQNQATIRDNFLSILATQRELALAGKGTNVGLAVDNTGLIGPADESSDVIKGVQF